MAKQCKSWFGYERQIAKGTGKGGDKGHFRNDKQQKGLFSKKIFRLPLVAALVPIITENPGFVLYLVGFCMPAEIEAAGGVEKLAFSKEVLIQSPLQGTRFGFSAKNNSEVFAKIEKKGNDGKRE